MEWTPSIGDEVIARAGTAEELVGQIVADFGDEQGHAVDVNNIRFAEPARRWAIHTYDGGLVFLDTADLSRPRRD